MDAPPEVIDELYGVPFDEFTARRDARAKELRKEKRREEADAVKALRKPALAAWAIDQLVRSDRDAVDELLAAGAALRQARRGDALRDATHEERDAVERLAERAAAVLREAGKPVTGKTAAELRDTLHAATLDDDVRDLLDRGRLVEPRQAIGLGGLEGAAPPEREPPQKAGKQPAPEKPRSGKADARKAKAAEGAERRRREAAARKALRDAEAALRERERALRGAERDIDARERDLKKAERARGSAQRAGDAARDAVDEAREQVERRRAELGE